MKLELKISIVVIKLLWKIHHKLSILTKQYGRNCEKIDREAEDLVREIEKVGKSKP